MTQLIMTFALAVVAPSKLPKMNFWEIVDKEKLSEKLVGQTLVPSFFFPDLNLFIKFPH